jgi:hypothetical protein
MTNLDMIIKKAAKKNAHATVVNLIRQFIERGELDEEDQEDVYEYDALQEIMRYHERLS